MKPVRMLWLALTVVGAILPWIYFARWFWANGLDMAGMIEAWNASDATTGLVYDLTWAYLCVALWALVECLPRRDWRGLVVLPVGLLIGVSAMVPLYLFLRSRPGWER